MMRTCRRGISADAGAASIISPRRMASEQIATEMLLYVGDNPHLMKQTVISMGTTATEASA